MIWCTIDPQINPEARINHVKRCDHRIGVRILALMRYVKLVW